MIELWNNVLLEPMINFLMVLSKAFGGSFGLAIIVLTLIINVIILPLTLRQIRSTKAMQDLQPKMQELNKKYAKDKTKLQQETMKLYRESGVNPLGCIFPLLIQTPIWIALYQAAVQTLGTTPERLFGVSGHLYSWSWVQQAVPPESNFLWMNLAHPSFVITILIMVTMWLSQKMTTVPSTDPKQQQMQSMMQWMMPLMFGLFFLAFPAGLGLYIVVMNIFRMVVQYFVMGNWGDLATLVPGRASAGTPGPADEKPSVVKTAKKSDAMTTKEEGIKNGASGSKRKNRK